MTANNMPIVSSATCELPRVFCLYFWFRSAPEELANLPTIPAISLTMQFLKPCSFGKESQYESAYSYKAEENSPKGYRKLRRPIMMSPKYCGFLL